MSIQILDDLDESVLKLIRDGLTKHAEAAGVGPRNHRPLNVLARGDGERMIGALVGATVWGWLEVNLLWVAPDARGHGLGSSMLISAEKEAAYRGCHHALLDTFNFQARRFYERHGYRVFGTLGDFPAGHERLFLSKKLRDDG